MKYLLDSVILIDHLNNISNATEWLKSNIKNSYISVITRAEILVGVESPHLTITKTFLERFKTLAITQIEADMAAELRRQYKWKLPDALQAAVAINHKLLFVTRNSKDFSPDIHAFTIIPYTVRKTIVKHRHPCLTVFSIRFPIDRAWLIHAMWYLESCR